MAIELITGLGDGPHVDASDVGGFQAGIVGEEDYMLPAGEQMKATVISNNKIRIAEGEAVMQGRHWRIKPNTYEDVTIENGAQNMNRKDAIIARYTKNADTGIEKVELAVLKGTPTSGTAIAPAQEKGNILEGTMKHEMLLYIVSLKGLNVESVTAEFDILMNMSEINKRLSDTSYEIIKSSTGYVKKYANGMFEAWAKSSVKNSDFTFKQIGNTILYYAQYRNFGFGIKATEVFNIQTSAMNNGVIWAARPSLNTNKEAVDGCVIQIGTQQEYVTYLDAYVVGRWK